MPATHVYVAEYPGLAATDQGDSEIVLPQPPTVEYIVNSNFVSIPFQSTTEFIEVSTPATCSIAIGLLFSHPTSTSNQRLAANDRKIFRVPPNPSLYGLAALVNS